MEDFSSFTRMRLVGTARAGHIESKGFKKKHDDDEHLENSTFALMVTTIEGFTSSTRK